MCGTDPDFARFERMLRDRRRAVAADLSALDARLAGIGALRDGNADDEHDPDGAPVSGEWSRLYGARREASAELVSIDGALARIADGSYGRCANCARPIAPARLEARPAAELCIECAAGDRRGRSVR
ncbi:TraR/DksA family transcriptional regulator [Gryllotalpicola ginsengisoli]|uniref:TraR/DksA family transcriptional regulator n=1 Tax=Gryllotalpicola ginsengisoli TaxID=444608 RepID=UPI0004180AD8|nr:TraR/DksA C4-type zinc finger protein [Gryllotalpicola ginsengisoli]